MNSAPIAHFDFTPTWRITALLSRGACILGASATSSACPSYQGNTPPRSPAYQPECAGRLEPGLFLLATGLARCTDALLGNFSATSRASESHHHLCQRLHVAAGAGGGNAAITGGAPHLTDAVTSQQGSFATPAVSGVVNSLPPPSKSRWGRTCCGARTADGWSFTGPSRSCGFPVAPRKPRRHPHVASTVGSTGLTKAPDIDIKWRNRLPVFDGIREGVAPAGPINDPATGLPMTYTTAGQFVFVRVHR